jgi:hypothetical protein
VDPDYTQTFSGDCSVAGEIILAGGDTKVCTITNEEIPQGSFLSIDVSGAYLGGTGNSHLYGIIMTNTVTNNVIITKIQHFWTTPNQNIKAIIIGGTTVWSFQGPGTPSSSQVSGTEIDIVDYTIAPGNSVAIDTMDFTGNMKDSDFTITFFFGDGSTITPHFCPTQPNSVCQ